MKLNVAGTLRVPSANFTAIPCRARSAVTARGACLLHGFTLFELILAIALSATLLGLIGTAINLYLLRVDAGRSRVEEAQLARAILAMIADDIRATTIYEPQDTSAIAQIIASSNSRDDDADDDSDGDSDGSPRSGGTGGTGGTGSATFIGGSGASSDHEDSDESSSASDDEQAGDSLPLGLSGTLTELYVDVTRLPRRDELFGTITGYTNAPMPLSTNATASGSSTTAAAAGVTPIDLKTVRYFIRQGERVDPASVAATPLAPELQQRAGGLVRQEIARPLRTFAESNGNRALLESGQVLLAPEIVHLEFRYYDGERVTDVWDMHEDDSLPVAIEVRIWLVSPDEAATSEGSPYDVTRLIANAREYRQTVSLPMSEVSGSDGGGSSSSAGSSFGSSSDSNGN